MSKKIILDQPHKKGVWLACSYLHCLFFLSSHFQGSNTNKKANLPKDSWLFCLNSFVKGPGRQSCTFNSRDSITRWCASNRKKEVLLEKLWPHVLIPKTIRSSTIMTLFSETQNNRSSQTWSSTTSFHKPEVQNNELLQTRSLNNHQFSQISSQQPPLFTNQQSKTTSFHKPEVHQ